MSNTISILRLGHRVFRDKRTTTHCALVSRSLGATNFYYTGEKDSSFEQSIEKTVKSWGGPFKVNHVKNHKKFIKDFSGDVVHLTVYGIPFEKRLTNIKKSKPLLIVIGGEKVPAEVYQLADYNLSVGSQPHSEVAALGILLYQLSGFKSRFVKSKLKIIPQERGKKLVRK